MNYFAKFKLKKSFFANYKRDKYKYLIFCRLFFDPIYVVHFKKKLKFIAQKLRE